MAQFEVFCLNCTHSLTLHTEFDSQGNAVNAVSCAALNCNCPVFKSLVKTHKEVTLQEKDIREEMHLLREQSHDESQWAVERACALGEQLIAALEEITRLKNLPEECQKQECTYFRHYLIYGGPDLVHEGYHAAEKKCSEAQTAYLSWLQQHDGDRLNPPKYLEDQVRYWEKVVRA